MKIYERQTKVPPPHLNESPLRYLSGVMSKVVPLGEQVVRVAVTKSTKDTWEIEFGTVEYEDSGVSGKWRSIFEYRQRGPENQNDFNVAIIVPTGIGAEIGGHAGDAGAVARLFANAVDRVITHPNVVNAADLNELPHNGLYVEGSILTRLLMGEVGLQEIRANRLLTIIDDHPENHLIDHSINSVGAARAVMGLECAVAARLPEALNMSSTYSESGRAAGEIQGLEKLVEVIDQYKGRYDAIAVTSRISVPKSYHQEYYLGGLVNPWGGVEAMLTHTLSTMTGLPSAHAPMMESEEILNLHLGVVDPRMAAEVVSVTYLHCVLKGLQRSPQVVWNHKYIGARGTLWAEDVSALVVPKGCVGLPVLAARDQGIPVIEVLDNDNLMENTLEGLNFSEGQLIQVRTYLEAVGVVNALKGGISLESLRRPLHRTHVEPALRMEEDSENAGVVGLWRNKDTRSN